MQGRNFLLAGPPGVGKSTLCAALLDHGGTVQKTQAPQYYGLEAVDLPGEYMTHPRWRLAFLSCAEGVKNIVVVIPADKRELLPPGDVLKVAPHVRLAGVISKVDVSGADVAAARRELAALGIENPVFEVSVHQPHTLVPLRHWLKGESL